MINFAIGFGFVAALSLIWVAIFGLVETLPFGMDLALQMFSDALHTAASILPLLDTPIQMVIWGISLKLSLWFIAGVMWIITLVRG